MIIRSLRKSAIAKQCCSSASFSRAKLNGITSVNCPSIPFPNRSNANNERCRSANNNDREFSSLALPLAKTTNGIVNIKSMNIPRPRPVLKTVVPPPHKLKTEQKINLTKMNGHVKLKEHRLEQKEPSPSHIAYVGDSQMPITSELKIVTPGDDTPSGIWPVFRMMDENGHFRQNNEISINSNKSLPPKHDLDQLRSTLQSQNPHFANELQPCTLLNLSRNPFPDIQSNNTLLRAHRQMIRLRKMDTILHNAQRQGRISFYMTNHGEEGIHIGSASALSPQDIVLAQYREAGVLMWRGFTLEQFCNQCFSNDLDMGRGRQMPVHYGSRALNYQTISSPLGTQITQAVGVAYKLKLDAMANPDGEAAISITYFGDGAASSVDFHSACNFAATLRVPMIFFCRNNGYAISTPVADQYAGDGIISRAPGYGMAGIRVDGNDVFAVHAAVSAAREHAIETSSPVMIEAMTYRQGHHSTSDDSSRYRDTDEVQIATDVSDPLVRLDQFLRRVGWMDENDVATVEDEERISVLRAMEGAESRPGPSLDTMFDDVYYEKPPHLVRQEDELRCHLNVHKIQYP